MNSPIGNPAAPVCVCTRPRVPIMRAMSGGGAVRVLLCTHCDAGGPNAAPPIMLDYLRKGHQ